MSTALRPARSRPPYPTRAYDQAVARAAAGLLPKWMLPKNGETEFDRILREAHIPLADAHNFLMVREWVERNCRQKYVPPAILEKFNIRPQDIA